MENESKFQKLCKRLIINGVHNLIKEPITKTILESILDVIIDEQDNISEKINALVEEPYKSGCDYLTDALTVEGAWRDELIKLALQKFITASNLETTLTAAKTQVIVGACYELLNEQELALNWYEKAYKFAWLLTLKETKLADSKKVDKAISYLKIGLALYTFPELYIFSKLFGKDAGSPKSFMMKILGKNKGKINEEYYTFLASMSDLLRTRNSKLENLL